jgi:nitrogen fixation NifU-like protein
VNEALYQDALMLLARRAVKAGSLARPDASATADNPLCGDRVAVDLSLENGRIVDLAHRVKGCVLCQASASLLGLRCIGGTAGDVAALKRHVESVLAGGEPSSAAPETAPFRPVAPHKSRHDCVLLPFRALEQALERMSAV